MKKILFLLACALLISACASTKTPQAIVAPQIDSVFPVVYQNQAVQLQVQDMRPQTHLIQIQRGDDAAELISSNTLLTSALQSALTPILQQQGLKTGMMGKPMQIAIVKALVTVQQALNKYQASNEIELKVTIKNGDKTLTKTFRQHGKSSGMFRADLAVLERDFNQQLGTLITRLVQDKQLQSFIKGAQ